MRGGRRDERRQLSTSAALARPRAPCQRVRPVGLASGTVNQNVLPSPGLLSTPISPPISSTSRCEIASPRPVPPYRRVVEPSACVNGSKSAAARLGGDADAGVADLEAQRRCCRPTASALDA